MTSRGAADDVAISQIPLLSPFAKGGKMEIASFAAANEAMTWQNRLVFQIVTQSIDLESTAPTHLDPRVPSPEQPRQPKFSEGWLWRVGDFRENDMLRLYYLKT
jgi:hypothetical protein